MGVDTCKQLHAVILRPDENDFDRFQLVHLAVCHEFSELDDLMKRFHVDRCVIDGLPETHATRAFAGRHPGQVYLPFFNEHQRGEAKWVDGAWTVQLNRTETLDPSRAAVREGKVILPRRQPLLDEFATHMAADAKILDENEETGAKKYRYIRTGQDHFSLAFTYAWIAVSSRTGARPLLLHMKLEAKKLRKNPPPIHRVRL